VVPPNTFVAFHGEDCGAVLGDDTGEADDVGVTLGESIAVLGDADWVEVPAGAVEVPGVEDV
jgi:hypothetical protein